jgi:hypothetical protein
MRIKLLRLDQEEHVLLVTMHHIVSDGWSMAIFNRELNTLYAAYAEGSEDPLPPLAIQYPDYAAWQREWLSGERLEAQANYWREALGGAPPLLPLLLVIGLVAAGVIAGHDERMNYRAVPAATFTHPEVASVGLTEARAREAGHDVVVGRFPFTALGRAQTYGSTEGLVKVVAGRRNREVLGVHIIGPGASDLIPEGVLAMHLEATLDDIADTIHAHPTLGESGMEAAMVALGLPVHTSRPRRR